MDEQTLGTNWLKPKSWIDKKERGGESRLKTLFLLKYFFYIIHKFKYAAEVKKI